MSFAAKDSAGRPFPSKKALKVAIEHGNLEGVVICDTSIISPRFGGSTFHRDGLRDGDMIHGPDPLGGVPNKWYARVVIDRQGNPTIR